MSVLLECVIFERRLLYMSLKRIDYDTCYAPLTPCEEIDSILYNLWLYWQVNVFSIYV